MRVQVSHVAVIGLVLFGVSGVQAAATPVQAVSAEKFIDSIGINLHVSYTRTPYWQRWDDTKSALIALGVRHFRDRIPDCTDRASKVFCKHFTELGQAGISGDFFVGLGTPLTQVSLLPSQIGNAVDAFEGPNEYDISNDANWLSNLTNFQRQLYTTVKGDPATAKYPVIGPSIGHFEHYAQAADLSSYFDYGNLHDYLGPSNPGLASDGRIHVWLQAAQSLNGAKPDVTTETGYWDGPPEKRLPFAVYPDTIIARYEPRLFLEQFKVGIVRTYQYELLDDPTHLDSLYAHGGLLNTSVQPKPQYYALQNLISLLKDPGSDSAPASLDYSLEGETDHLERLLFSKRDGSMYLAFWIEKPSYDLRTRQDTNIAPQHVKLTVNGQIGNVNLVTFQDSGQTTRSALPFNGRSSELSVADRVVIVCFPAK
jgi:hypothetical protein